MDQHLQQCENKLRQLLMKSFLKFLSILLSSVVFAQAPSEILWGDEVSGVSIGILVSNVEFHVNEPITVTSFVRNNSTELLLLNKDPLNWYFDIIATGRDRKPLARQPRGGSSMGHQDRLLPGETKSYELNLHEFVAVANPDELVITIKRTFFDRQGTKSALSGNAMIRIVAAGAKPLSAEASSTQSPTGKFSSTQHFEKVSADSHRPRAAPRHFGGSGTSATERPNPLNQSDANAAPLASTVPVAKESGLTRAQKIGAGILAVLLAFTLAFLWRAARRKPPA
jgi:hypothetical protein